ncbi:MAG: DUF3857 domain-containing protein, partial [Chitinophagaceae bacterium]|nr:DUF3857 domain-containing protein [Chitinophagaceae bacterium]
MKSITIKKSIALFLFAGSLATIQAQDGSSLTMVSWNKQPAVHQVVDKHQNESAVILFDSRRIEYIDNGDKLEQYRTLHKLIHINDDRGIEAFNKIYLDVSDNADIRDIKARTILPGGRIIEIDKSNIKDIQEKDRSYKIFAMEGVQKGCEIEFYYTYKVPVNYFGRETLQGSFPVVKSGVEIVAPERLVFEIKPFNDIEKATDTVKDKKRIVSVSGENIVAAEDEKYSA